MDPSEEVEEVDPEAELASLREKVGKLEELEKTKVELEGKVKEYESDEQNMNWRKAREKEKRLIATIKAAGREVDDEGNLLDKPREFTEEELAKKTGAQVEKILIEKEITRAEKKLAESDRPIFRKAYEKVIHGEEVNSDNVTEFVDQALSFAGRSQERTAMDRSSGTRGGAPVLEETGKTFADTPEAEGLASMMGIKIASNKKK